MNVYKVAWAPPVLQELIALVEQTHAVRIGLWKLQQGLGEQ